MDELDFGTSAGASENDGWDSIDCSSAAEEDETPNQKTLEDIVSDWNGEDQRNPRKDSAVPAKDQKVGDDGGLFTLKHLDRTLNVNRDEVVRLAQKGLDYDRVKTKYSELSAMKNLNSGAVDYVNRLAGERGISAEEFIKGGAAGSFKNAETNRLNADIDEFLASCPDVSAKDIPQSVWDEVSKGRSLLASYIMHENTLLKAELEAERQNIKNRELSVSSRSSEGKGQMLSELERLWYEDD